MTNHDIAAPPPSVRAYEIGAESTRTLGRVLCSARELHFIVDGPAQNGCPGEEITPVVVFVSAVGACGVELVEVIAREEGSPVESVKLRIRGEVDRGKQARSDVTLFTKVELDFTIAGAGDARAAALVESFRRR